MLIISPQKSSSVITSPTLAQFPVIFHVEFEIPVLCLHIFFFVLQLFIVVHFCLPIKLNKSVHKQIVASFRIVNGMLCIIIILIIIVLVCDLYLVMGESVLTL